jgi:hypothetical protein
MPLVKERLYYQSELEVAGVSFGTIIVVSLAVAAVVMPHYYRTYPNKGQAMFGVALTLTIPMHL